MGWLLDTSIAVQLRDRDQGTLQRLQMLEGLPLLSIITRVELEGGIYAHPKLTDERRHAVDKIIQTFETLDFDKDRLAAYRNIVAAIGFSRRLVVDRMIAATALVHGLSVITANSGDFQNVPELQIEEWPAAASPG